MGWVGLRWKEHSRWKTRPSQVDTLAGPKSKEELARADVMLNAAHAHDFRNDSSSFETAVDIAQFYCARERTQMELVSRTASIQSPSCSAGPGDKNSCPAFAVVGEMLSHTKVYWGILPPLLKDHRVYWLQGRRHLLGSEHLRSIVSMGSAKQN